MTAKLRAFVAEHEARRKRELDAIDAANIALAHVLRRVQTDADFRYHMLDTEALVLVIKAYAALTGRSPDDVRDLVERNAPRGESRCAELRELASRLP